MFRRNNQNHSDKNSERSLTVSKERRQQLVGNNFYLTALVITAGPCTLFKQESRALGFRLSTESSYSDRSAQPLESRKSMEQNAREEFASKYTRSRNYEILEQIYRQTLEEQNIEEVGS